MTDKLENNPEFEITLRALEPADIDVIYKWENDPDIGRISNTYTPYSKYILEKYIENSHLDIFQVKQMRLMIDVRDRKEDLVRSIGTIDLFDFDPYHNRAGVGILIGEKSDRKRGYATMALKKFIHYGFNILQLHQLYCNIVPENLDSMKLFKNQGFRICGKKKDWIRTPGRYVEEYTLQLINPNDSGGDTKMTGR
ncbi:MAG: GNAT family N-acetyltransferase [Bacteroidales bacterium]|nr:GNAT family N-acetyltransferase [Bacteroidales bacterium]